jgi:hypothetical protein
MTKLVGEECLTHGEGERRGGGIVVCGLIFEPFICMTSLAI